MSSHGATSMQAQLPPGPDDSSSTQTLRLLRDSWQYTSEQKQAHGDIFTLRPLSSPPVVVVSNPILVRNVFTGPSILQAGIANRILEPASGANSVLFLDGEEHLERRRLLLPAFQGARLKNYVPIIEKIIRTEFDSWPLGVPVALYSRFKSIALEVMLQIVFGNLFVHQHVQLKEDLLSIQFAESRLRSRAALNDIVRDSRAMEDVPKSTILGMLISAKDKNDEPFTDDKVVDELLALLVAGEETTAGTLAWATERISRHLAIQRRLQEELRGQGVMNYLDAVVTELLRIRPVLQWSVRHLTEPLSLGDWFLPKDVVVAVSIYLLHMRPDLYPDPEKLIPDRFLHPRPRIPYTCIPFGGGVRRCLGAGLAILEITTILRELLARFILLPPRGCEADEAWLRNGITFVPAKGATVCLMPNRSQND
jgi:cytochrome P450